MLAYKLIAAPLKILTCCHATLLFLAYYFWLLDASIIFNMIFCSRRYHTLLYFAEYLYKWAYFSLYFSFHLIFSFKYRASQCFSISIITFTTEFLATFILYATIRWRRSLYSKNAFRFFSIHSLLRRFRQLSLCFHTIVFMYNFHLFHY